MRRKFRQTAQSAPIQCEVLTDVSAVIDELYPLYLQVHARSKMHFEKLTPAYFCRLGREMPDRTRFFVWRQEGKAIAFSLCLVHDGTIYDDYLGLDYRVAFDLNLYFYTLRDIISWALGAGSAFLLQQPAELRSQTPSRLRAGPARSLRHAHWALAQSDLPPRSPLPPADPARSCSAAIPQRARIVDGAAAAFRCAVVIGSARRWFVNPWVQLAICVLLATAAEIFLKLGARGDRRPEQRLVVDRSNRTALGLGLVGNSRFRHQPF